MTTIEKEKVSTGKFYKVDPRKIVILPDLNPAGRCDDVSDIIDSIKENGVLEPLQGYREQGKYYLTSGHRRLTATLKLIKEGSDIKTVPFLPKPKLSSDQLFFDVFTHNSGKPLNEIQEGETILKLIGYGWKQEEIAKKINKTQAYISQKLKLYNNTTKLLKNYIIQEIISPHAAMIITEKYNDENEQKNVIDRIIIKKSKLKGKATVEQAIKILNESNKFKISSSDIPNKPGRQKIGTVKRISKLQKNFLEYIEYMKKEEYKPVQISKIETIGKILEENKTPNTIIKKLLPLLK